MLHPAYRSMQAPWLQTGSRPANQIVELQEEKVISRSVMFSGNAVYYSYDATFIYEQPGLLNWQRYLEERVDG
jgi:hypothetical protein